MEKELYKVFAVDICCHLYAIDKVFIGASNVEDLKAHYDEIAAKYFTMPLGNEEDWVYMHVSDFGSSGNSFEGNVNEVPHMYTDEPYTILQEVCYSE